MALFWVEDAESARCLKAALPGSGYTPIALVGPKLPLSVRWLSMDKAATLLKAAFANEGANEPDKFDSTAATTEAIAAGMHFLDTLDVNDKLKEMICLVNTDAEDKGIGQKYEKQPVSSFAAEPYDDASLSLYGLLRRVNDIGGQIRLWDTSSSIVEDIPLSPWPRLLRVNPYSMWVALFGAKVWHRSHLPPLSTVSHNLSEGLSADDAKVTCWQGFLHAPRGTFSEKQASGTSVPTSTPDAVHDCDVQGEAIFIEISGDASNNIYTLNSMQISYISVLQRISQRDIEPMGLHLLHPIADGWHNVVEVSEGAAIGTAVSYSGACTLNSWATSISAGKSLLLCCGSTTSPKNDENLLLFLVSFDCRLGTLRFHRLASPLLYHPRAAAALNLAVTPAFTDAQSVVRQEHYEVATALQAMAELPALNDAKAISRQLLDLNSRLLCRMAQSATRTEIEDRDMYGSRTQRETREQRRQREETKERACLEAATSVGNKTKIEKRWKQNMIKGDGSRREERTTQPAEEEAKV